MRDRRCAYCDKKLGQALFCDECGTEPLTKVRLLSLVAILREGLTPSIKQARYLAYHLCQLYEAAEDTGGDVTTRRVVAETRLENLEEAINLALCKVLGHQEEDGMGYHQSCVRCGVRTS